MPNEKQSNAWMAWAVQYYDTDEAGVRAIMLERAKKGPAARKAKEQAEGKKHIGGFNVPKVAKDAGRKGAAKRWSKD